MFVRFNGIQYKLVSVSHESATSVELKPQLPFQEIRLGLPCDIWSNASGESRLCGYPYVGFRGDYVVASVERTDYVKWTLDPAPYPNAYIVRLRDNPQQVWTVSPENSLNPHIMLRPYCSTEDQFFRLEMVDG